MTVGGLKNVAESSASYPSAFSDVLNRFLGEGRQIALTMEEFIRHIEIGPDVSEIVSIIMSVSEEDSSLCEALIPLVREHIAQNVDYPDLHDSLGTLYLRLNRLEEARLSFEEAVRLNPRFLNARFNLFYTLKSLGKNKEALEHGEFIFAEKLSYPDFYCTLAEVYLDLDMYENSLMSVTRTMEMNPQYARAHFLLARIYEKQGRTGDALSELEKCTVCKPPAELQALVGEALDRLKSS